MNRNTRTWPAKGPTLLIALAALTLWSAGCSDNGQQRSVISPRDGALLDVNPSQQDWKQCENNKDAASTCNWVTGNLDSQHNSYQEGDIVPHWLRLPGVTTTDPITVTLGHNLKKAGKATFDFLTTYNRSQVNAQPCNDSRVSAFCSGGSLSGSPVFVTTSAVYSGASGADQTALSNSYAALGGTQRLYAYNASSISIVSQAVTYSSGGNDADATVTLSIVPQAGATEVLLLVGSHIAKGVAGQWGVGGGASGVQGSPYHLSIEAINGAASGSMDLQMASNVIVVPPNLTVGKTAGSASVLAGSPISFTITVSNAADAGTANAVTLSDPLPGGAGIDWSISAQPGGNPCSIAGSPQSETLNCSFGNLAAGASASVTVTSNTTPASCGVYNNVASVSGSNFATIPSPQATTTVNCVHLQVTKTAATSLTRTYNWSIVKTASPTSLDMFTGESGTVGYTVTVTRTGSTDAQWAVSGTISILNQDSYANVITSVSDAISGDGSPVPNCGVTFPYTLAAGATLNCTYSSSLADGSNRVNTATAVSNGQSFTGTAAVDFSTATVTPVNPTAHVIDTYNNLSWSFNDTGTQTYNRTFACDADQGTINNTATITETSQSSSAAVTVTCKHLTVTNTLSTTWNRGWTWTAAKGVRTAGSGSFAPALNITLDAGSQTYLAEWLVSYNAVSQGGLFSVVGGDIAVSNPAGIAATIASVSDVISGAGAPGVTPNCGSSFPITLPGGSTLHCTYVASLPDGAARTGTSTVVQTLTSGPQSFINNAAIAFASSPTTTSNNCINVSDTFPLTTSTGSLPSGVICAEGPAPGGATIVSLPKNYQYTALVGPYSNTVCGQPQYVNNTAAFTSAVSGTSNSGLTGAANAQVVVTIPCTGCTLTQGYWKTHSDRDNLVHGPAYDDVWNLILNNGPYTPFYNNQLSGGGGAMSWQTMFNTPPSGGNAYISLAHQYEATKLNILSGVGAPTAVSSILASVESFLSANVWQTTLDAPTKNQARGWAGTLASFNEGAIGPGHCSEDQTSSPTP